MRGRLAGRAPLRLPPALPVARIGEQIFKNGQGEDISLDGLRDGGVAPWRELDSQLRDKRRNQGRELLLSQLEHAQD